MDKKPGFSIPTTFMNAAKAKTEGSKDNNESQPVKSDEATAKRLLKQLGTTAAVVVGTSLALTYVLKRVRDSIPAVTPEDETNTED